MIGLPAATSDRPRAHIRPNFKSPAAAVRRAIPFILAILLLPATAATEPTLKDGWALLGNYRFREADEVFVSPDLPKDSRAAALGHAAALLNSSPITPGKVATADQLLHNLIAAPPEDDLTVSARYLAARIAHLHRPNAVTEARQGYVDLIDRHPHHSLAQLAASKLALIYLYQRPDLELDARLNAAAALEPIAGADALPEVAVAYHRAIAEASLYYDRVDDRVLRSLQRALALEPADPLIISTLHVQAAEVARDLGLVETARAHYKDFIAGAEPTDMRLQTVRDRLAALPANSPASSQSDNPRSSP